jgi:hydrogenase-4 component B
MPTITAELIIALATLVPLVGSLLCALLAGFGGTSHAARQRLGWFSFALMLLTAVLIFSAVGCVLVDGPSSHPLTLIAADFAGDVLRFHIDGLSALFLVLVAFIGVAAALYSVNYMQHYPDYHLIRYYPAFLIFIAGMIGLLATTDMLGWFALFWQMMTLSSFLLIRFEWKETACVRAAWVYLLMMQIACVFLMLAGYLLEAPHGEPAGLAHDLETMSAALPTLLAEQPRWGLCAFGLLLAGFAIKMGLWPFGSLWLPDAHPAAPSPVSALLSGVMLKTGLYGLLRTFLCLAPPVTGQGHFSHAGWGTLIVILGVITLCSGTLQAIKQTQSKRLLAFSSIGQVGYMAFAAGAALLMASNTSLFAPAPLLAAVSLLGVLFHATNHALFKSTLFLSAGATLAATGTQDMNKLGGLFPKLPVTALCALVASLSIAGVPLFNGFASKWAIYVAGFQGGAVAWFLPLCAALALMVSVFTLACFIKFYGVIFLSRPSAIVCAMPTFSAGTNAESAQAGFGLPMKLPQIVLAGACIILGLFPDWGIRGVSTLIGHTHQGVLGQIAAAFHDHSWIDAQSAWGMNFSTARIMPLATLALLGGLWLFVRWLAGVGGSRPRAVAPWLCGYAQEGDWNRYTARHHFSDITRLLGWLGGMPKSSPDKPLAQTPDMLLQHKARLETLRARRLALQGAFSRTPKPGDRPS